MAVLRLTWAEAPPSNRSRGFGLSLGLDLEVEDEATGWWSSSSSSSNFMGALGFGLEVLAVGWGAFAFAMSSSRFDRGAFWTGAFGFGGAADPMGVEEKEKLILLSPVVMVNVFTEEQSCYFDRLYQVKLCLRNSARSLGL
jgi:hypothetical protein